MTPGGALPPAIVIGGNANAVSVARSIAALGVRVVALGNGADQVRYSRACSAYVAAADGVPVQEHWFRWLAEHRTGAILLPCDDDALELIGSQRPALLELGYRPFEADDTVLLAMLDKEATYSRARAAGIPTPRTLPARTLEEALAAGIEIGFPCALKPVHSQRFARRFHGRKAFVVGDVDDLRSAHARTAGLGLEMIVTEIIPGPDDRLCSYYSFIDADGRALFGVTKRKIRQFPRGFGLGSLEITDRAPDVAVAGDRFFRAVGIRGLANVEFKRDPRDGLLKLIECNHRFTASNELVRRAGVDLARLAYGRLAGLAPLPLDRYREGMTMWNPLRDIRSIAGAAREDVSTLPGSVQSVLRPHVLPVFRLDDPMPSIAHHVRLVAKVPGKFGFHRGAGETSGLGVKT